MSSLPFQLTGAQKRCIQEITGDMERGTPPMNRLLQGEVGSGKTVVALAALLKVAADGFPRGGDGPHRGAGGATLSDGVPFVARHGPAHAIGPPGVGVSGVYGPAGLSGAVDR